MSRHCWTLDSPKGNRIQCTFVVVRFVRHFFLKWFVYFWSPFSFLKRTEGKFSIPYSNGKFSIPYSNVGQLFLSFAYVPIVVHTCGVLLLKHRRWVDSSAVVFRYVGVCFSVISYIAALCSRVGSGRVSGQCPRRKGEYWCGMYCILKYFNVFLCIVCKACQWTTILKVFPTIHSYVIYCNILLCIVIYCNVL